MLNRMMTVGNRWTKGNMNRVYVNTVEVTTFEEGKEYTFTKVTDAGTWRKVTCRVTKRTAQFVTLENAETGATVRKKIKVHSARNCEYVIPLGIDGNSAPALWANAPTESEPEVEITGCDDEPVEKWIPTP